MINMLVTKFSQCQEKITVTIFSFCTSAFEFFILKKKYVLYIFVLCIIGIASWLSLSYGIKKNNEKQMELYVKSVLQMQQAKNDAEKVIILKKSYPQFNRNIKLIVSIELAAMLKKASKKSEAISFLRDGITAPFVDKTLRNNAIIYLSSMLLDHGDEPSLKEADLLLKKICKKDSFYELALQKRIIIYTMLSQLAKANELVAELKKLQKDGAVDILSSADISNLEYFIGNHNADNKK